MKRKEKISKSVRFSGLWIMVLLGSVVPAYGVSVDTYCSTPPQVSQGVPPNVLILLDNSGSMNDQAYAGSYDPSQFVSGYYYGYFDPTKNYKYTNNGRWEITNDPLTNGTTANPIASGNFLNWATMRRVDVAKKLLIGGKASPRSPQGNVTVKLFGENSSSSWNFSKDHDNSSDPNLIYPFTGNYRYSMSGDQFRITPVVVGGGTQYSYPTANISAPAAWTVTGAAAAWDAVNEVSADGDTTYIRTNATSTPVILDYNFTGSKTGTITSVSVVVRAKKSISNRTLRIQGAVQISGTPYYASYQNVGSTSYDNYTFTWTVNPATGSAWQWNEIKSSGVGSLEGFGAQISYNASSSNYLSVTQVYMIVSSSNPSGGPYSLIVDQGMVKAEGIIDDLSSDVRFGLSFYNSGCGLECGNSNGRNDGAYVANYVDFGSTTNMITSIQNMSPTTWTPLAESVYEMVRMFRQESPYYSNSPADYQVGNNYDPYYYQYTKLAGSNLPDQFVPCAKSFILLLTDGESTQDQNIPLSLRDFDNDGNDPGTYASNGTDYLDDVALWARTTDHRPLLTGNQNIILYSVFMFGQGSPLLKDAAINGGFNDLNDDGLPGPDVREYLRDSNEDGIIDSNDLPLTYFEGNDGYELEQSITAAIESILRRAASGTAVSVLTTSSRGIGSLVQAYFLPVKQEGTREVAWTGYLQNIWVDPSDNIREDTVNDYNLKLDQDRVMKLFFNELDNETQVGLFSTDVDGNGGTLAMCTPDETKPFSEASYLWEAGEKLALKVPSSRTLFTSTKVIRTSGTSTITTTTTNITDNDFTVSNITADTTLSSALSPDATYTAENIVRYTRGECLETGVNGNTPCGSTASTYRDRRVSISGGGPNGNVWKLGDIINSTPKVLATTPLNTYHIDYGDSTYHAYFSSTNYKQRSSIAFVGANDGMLHAFRVGYLKDTGLAATIKGLFKNFFGSADNVNNQLGEEVWGYIPFNAFPYLKYLAYPDYCHIYYNDLSVRLVDASLGCSTDTSCDEPTETRTSNSWKTILIGGMRFGGACSAGINPGGPPTEDNTDAVGDNDGICESGETCLTTAGYSSYFAIDVTDAENPVPLWEFSDDDLGYATTFPSVLRTGNKQNNGHWYVAFGSGSKQLPRASTDIARTSTGYVYILNLKTGELVKKISLDNGDAVTDDNHIVADILAVDADKDYVSEKIYFGTAYNSSGWKGKLMAISIPDQDLSSSWTPAIKYLFSDNYPFTSSPDAARDVNGNIWVFAGSGKFFSDLDETDNSTQIFVGFKDKNDGTITYPLAANNLDDRTNTNTTGTVTGTTQVCLYDSASDSFSLQTVVTTINQTSSPVTDSTTGWRLSFTGGERIITRPLAVGGVVDFLTYKPSADVCAFGGDSYLYAVDYTKGVAPSSVAIRAPGITTGTSGTVTVKKGVKLGPGAPPTGEAIIIPPPKEGQETLKKKIQVATGVIVETENKPTVSVFTKIMHWLKK